MASRKEQKEQLRREREEREAAERSAAGRKRLIGYVAGGAVVLAVVAVAAFVLLSGSDDGGGSSATASSDVLPDGGEVPDQTLDDLDEAARAAGCELESFKAKSRDHVSDVNEQVEYASDPPTSGQHFEAPAEDGAYEEAPDVKALVHTLEHSRVIVWFKPGLPAQQRANLKALFDEDSFQMVLTPDETMPYDVAATAWSREPTPLGTGRLLGCDTYDEKVFDAIRSFRDEHRSNGPEPVP